MKTCQMCRHWKRFPKPYEHEGMCAYPIPRWLLVDIEKRNDGTRVTRATDQGCPTWEGPDAIPYSFGI